MWYLSGCLLYFRLNRWNTEKWTQKSALKAWRMQKWIQGNVAYGHIVYTSLYLPSTHIPSYRLVSVWTVAASQRLMLAHPFKLTCLLLLYFRQTHFCYFFGCLQHVATYLGLWSHHMQAQLQIAMYSNFSSCVVVIPHTYQTHYLVAQKLMWIFSQYPAWQRSTKIYRSHFLNSLLSPNLYWKRTWWAQGDLPQSKLTSGTRGEVQLITHMLFSK